MLFGVFMLFFAKPEFHVDLAAMNSVTRETLAAERLVRSVWGDVLNRVFLATEGKTWSQWRSRDDRLADLLEDQTRKGIVSSAFVPAMIFPGPERAHRRRSAWRAFWTTERVAGLRRAFDPVAQELGFSPQAFSDFFSTLERHTEGRIEGSTLDVPDIPAAYFPLLSMVKRPDGSGYRQFSSFTPGPRYQGEAFYRKVMDSGRSRYSIRASSAAA